MTPRTQVTIASGVCVSLSALYAEADVVFAKGGPDANSVKAKIDQIDKANAKSDRKKANDAAFNTVRFILQKFGGPQRLAGTSQQVGQLISHVFCFAGLDIVVNDPANAKLIDPSAQTQVVTATDNTVGVQVPPSAITEPTVLEFTKLALPQTITRMDQYSGYVVVSVSSASGRGTAAPVVVAICPDATVPSSVQGRLRLGQQQAAGYAITPSADASFLACPGSSASAGALRGWLDRALSLVMPKALYAAAKPMFAGGVAGTATEFGPFAPVDPVLIFSGGVGGTYGSFRKTGSRTTGFVPIGPVRKGAVTALNLVSPGPKLFANIIAACPTTPGQAPWSSELSPECRPGIVVRTSSGTVMQNVPVSWAVTGGAGTVAPESVIGTCGTFGATAATTTADSTAVSDPALIGRAGICWTMGATPGSNSVSATPSAGGDAPVGTIFTPASTDFTALGIKTTPVVKITCSASATFNGNDQTPCGSTAVVTDTIHSLPLGTVPLTYSPTPPHAAGAYAADASFGATTLYEAASAHATFNIVAPATADSAASHASEALRQASNAIESCNSACVSSTMADAYTASWNNYQMYRYSSEPRIALDNPSIGPDPVQATWTAWNNALAEANLALKQIRSDNVQFTSANARAQSEVTALFAQAVSWGNLSLLFDRAFARDWNTDTSTMTLVNRRQMRDAALAKLDTAITLATANAFSMPASWMNGNAYSSQQIIQLANTFGAYILANYARDATENAAVDWSRVAAYAANGISAGSAFDFSFIGDGCVSWCPEIAEWFDAMDTGRVDTRVANLLDPATQQTPWPFPGGNPIPNSPDKRLGDGSFATAAEVNAFGTYPKTANAGTDFAWSSYAIFRPDRGSYHQSNIGFIRYDLSGRMDFNGIYDGYGPYPVVTATLNDLLWAEALIHTGDLSGAAALINKTRVVRGGLSPASGGDGSTALLAKLHYEQEIELLGIGSTPFFDRRRVDGLQPGTAAEFPVPASVLSSRGLPIYTFGGGGLRNSPTP